MKKSNLMRKLLSVFLALGVIMTLTGCKKAQDTTTEKPQASPPAPAMSEAPQKSEEIEAVPTPSAAVTPGANSQPRTGRILFRRFWQRCLCSC